MYDTLKSFYYDPFRQGFDTNEWRVLGGTVVQNANRIEVLNGAISHYTDITKGDVSFNLIVPSLTQLSSIVGLYAPSRGAFAVFSLTSGLFTASVSNGETTVSSPAIPWDSTWTGVNTKFRIVWEAGLVKFSVAGTQVAVISGDQIPNGPLSLYVFDTSATPILTGSIEVKGAQALYTHVATSSTTAPVEQPGLILGFDNVTVSEGITIKIPTLVPNVFDSVTVSENYAKAIV
jgi:hypothetical protein